MELMGTVHVVLINDVGEILGVTRKDNHNDFGLIGGKIEVNDKTPKMAAIREAYEETGLSIYNLELILSMYGGDGTMGHTYLAKYKGDVNYDKEKEPHVVKWVSFQEVIKGKFGSWNEIVYKSLKNKKDFSYKLL